jgi:hypothetical protein
MKEDINVELKKISIPLKVLVDEISTGLKFWPPEFIEKMRLYVAPISQRGYNLGNFTS